MGAASRAGETAELEAKNRPQSKVYTPGLVTFLKDLSSGPRDGMGEGLSEMVPACCRLLLPLLVPGETRLLFCMEYRDPEPQDSSFCRIQSGGGWGCCWLLC